MPRKSKVAVLDALANEPVPVAAVVESILSNPPEPEPEKKKFATDPFPIAGDILVGAYLADSKRFKRSIIHFDEKPSQNVIDALKEAQFRWNNYQKHWWKAVGQETANQDRLEARELFNKIAKMIRTERNIEHDIGAPSL
ncbi:MAG: hypothetical protein SGI88_03560 [Candidatus Hydrogenedentes bacterium]|nr:hypothetical protein [Candidatus Hydrogenedentota bacterium]